MMLTEVVGDEKETIMDTGGKRLLKPSEARDILDLKHVNDVYRLLRSGDLKGFKIKTTYRIEAASVRSYQRRMETLEDSLTVEDVMEEFNLGRVFVYNLINEGILPAQKVHSIWRIPRSEYEAFKSGQRVA